MINNNITVFVVMPWIGCNPVQRKLDRFEVINVRFVTAQGLSEGHITPYTDIELRNWEHAKYTW